MIARTSYVHDRRVPKSIILECGLDAMLQEALRCIEIAREAEDGGWAEDLVRPPLLQLPLWAPMHQKRGGPIKIRGNPWRRARRERERERLTLLTGKEG